MQSETLFFKKLTQNAFAPFRATEGSAGVDLSSAYSYKVLKGGRTLVLTDLQVKLPAGCYGRIAPRSGISLWHGIHVGAGVIDSDYRGQIGILIYNLGDEDYEIKPGDRVAQLICEKICIPVIHEVDYDSSET